LIDSGLSSRQIAARIGIDYLTVNRLCTEARPGIYKCRVGRSATLNATNKRQLVPIVTSGKADTAANLAQELRETTGMDSSQDTVRRTLTDAALKAAPTRKEPRLLQTHRRQCMGFAIRNQHWTVEDWKLVIWLDEKKTNRLGSDGRKWCWKKTRSTLTEQYVQ